MSATSPAGSALRDGLGPEARRISDFLVGNSSSPTPAPSSASTTGGIPKSAAAKDDLSPGARRIYEYLVGGSTTPPSAGSEMSTVLRDTTTVDVFPTAVDFNVPELAATVPTTCSSECPCDDANASVSVDISSATPNSPMTTCSTVPELAAHVVNDRVLDVDVTDDTSTTAAICLSGDLDDCTSNKDSVDMSLILEVSPAIGGCSTIMLITYSSSALDPVISAAQVAEAHLLRADMLPTDQVREELLPSRMLFLAITVHADTPVVLDHGAATPEILDASSGLTSSLVNNGVANEFATQAHDVSKIRVTAVVDLAHNMFSTVSDHEEDSSCGWLLWFPDLKLRPLPWPSFECSQVWTQFWSVPVREKIPRFMIKFMGVTPGDDTKHGDFKGMSDIYAIGWDHEATPIVGRMITSADVTITLNQSVSHLSNAAPNIADDALVHRVSFLLEFVVKLVISQRKSGGETDQYHWVPEPLQFHPLLERRFQVWYTGKTFWCGYGPAQFQWEIAWPTTTHTHSAPSGMHMYLTLKFYTVMCSMEIEIKGWSICPVLVHWGPSGFTRHGLQVKSKFRKIAWLCLEIYLVSSQLGRNGTVTIREVSFWRYAMPLLNQTMLNDTAAAHSDIVRYLHSRGHPASDKSDCVASQNLVVPNASTSPGFYFTRIGLLVTFPPGLDVGQDNNMLLAVCPIHWKIAWSVVLECYASSNKSGQPLCQTTVSIEDYFEKSSAVLPPFSPRTVQTSLNYSCYYLTSKKASTSTFHSSAYVAIWGSYGMNLGQGLLSWDPGIRALLGFYDGDCEQVHDIDHVHIGHDYYLGHALCFDEFSAQATTYCYIGTFIDQALFSHDYHINLAQVLPNRMYDISHFYQQDAGTIDESHAPWDPGGLTWTRLEVKPNFMEGGLSTT